MCECVNGLREDVKDPLHDTEGLSFNLFRKMKLLNEVRGELCVSLEKVVDRTDSIICTLPK